MDASWLGNAAGLQDPKYAVRILELGCFARGHLQVANIRGLPVFSHRRTLVISFRLHQAQPSQTWSLCLCQAPQNKHIFSQLNRRGSKNF